MQMKKLLLTFPAIALMFLSSSAFALQSDNFTYEVSGSDNVTITGYTGSGGAVAIPETINTMPVVTIGNYAFYGAGFTSVTIANNLTSIGNGAFENCTGLTSVTIAGNVTSIGIDAFAITGLTSVSIPASVTSIGYGVFADCTALTGIDVEAGNPAYTSQDGVLYNKIKTELVQYPNGKAGDFTIPDNVTMLWIGAFYGATSLTSVTIPGSVTSIGDQIFTLCTGLTGITVDASNSVYSSQDGVLYNYAKTALIQYPPGESGSFNIPGSVTTIGDSAFSYCSGLTGVIIPGSVTTISASAFSFCTGLTSVTIPASVISIGQWAFRRCAGLTSITIPGRVTTIGYGTFYDCSGLTSVTIPGSVTTIETYAFAFCPKLTVAYFYGNAPEMGPDVFYGSASGFTAYHTDWNSGFTNPWYGYTTALFCPAPELNAPDGAGITPQPIFSWEQAGPDSWYNVLVWSETANNCAGSMWVGPASCTNGTCSAQFVNSLAPGKNWWWLNVWYGDLFCGFMEQPGGKFKEFTVEACAGPSLTSPDSVAITAGTKPTFIFSDTGAEWYNILVWTSAGYLALNQWEDKTAKCDAGTCTVLSNSSFGAGTTNWWWLNTYSSACGFQMQPGGLWKSFTQN